MNIPFDPTSSFSLHSALIKNRHLEIYFPANESLVLRIFHSSNFHNLRSSSHRNFREYVSYGTLFAPFNRLAFTFFSILELPTASVIIPEFSLKKNAKNILLIMYVA